MTAAERKPPTSAFVLAFAGIYLIWGSTYLGMRVAVKTMPPFLMAGSRFAIAGALLFAFLKLRGYAWPTRKQWRDAGVAGAFLLLGGNGLVAWSELYIPSSIAALLLAVQPVSMALTEWAWPGGQRPTLGMFLGMALGLFGVAWLVAPWEASATNALYPPGVIALAVGCVSWSIGSIYSRHAKPAAPPFMGSAIQMLCGGLALMLAAGARGEFSQFHFNLITGSSWLAYAYLIVIGSLVGFSTFVWLMKHSTPARVATYAYVNPVVAVFLGWLVLDEPIKSRTLFAAAVIVAAVVIVTTQKNRRKVPVAASSLERKEPLMRTNE